VVFTALGLLVALRIGNRRLVSLLPALLLGSALVFLIKKSIPFSRTWIYFIPFVLVLADAGYAWCVGAVAPGVRRALNIGLFLGTAAFAFGLARNGVINDSKDSGASNSAPAMAAQIDKLVPGRDWICARTPDDVPLRYYLTALRANSAWEFSASGQVHYVLRGAFEGNRFVSRKDVVLEARAGDLAMFGLLRRANIDQAGDSYHCWLRAGVFLG
jgi:hypothetical protein